MCIPSGRSRRDDARRYSFGCTFLLTLENYVERKPVRVSDFNREDAPSNAVVQVVEELCSRVVIPAFQRPARLEPWTWQNVHGVALQHVIDSDENRVYEVSGMEDIWWFCEIVLSSMGIRVRQLY
jgi:hypothetical protein